jgi:integrase
MQLTDRTIRDAKPRRTAYRLRDDNIVCRGFGLTIAPSGAKAFFLNYTSPIDGKRKQVSLGRFPLMSLKEARIKAAEMRALVDRGVDPAVEKQQTITATMARRTLGSLKDLMELYAADLERDGKRTAKEVRRITNKDLPAALLARPSHLISKDDILDILTPIAQRGAAVHADNVRAYLRAAFELGINAEGMTRWRGNKPKFDLTLNPVATVRKSARRKPRGQRSLSWCEVAELWNADLLTPPMHLTLKMILATGQRVEEVLQATWSEFDRSKMLWTIPGERRKTRGKTSEPHLVPLTVFHMDLLEEIQRTTAHPIFLFPARGGIAARRYDALTSAVGRFVKSSGMVSFASRDLRRTFKTLAGGAGIPLEIRNRLQGHAMTDVGSLYYDRHDYLAEKKTAMDTWIEALSEAVGGNSNVR